MPPNTTNVSRPGIWGNPYRLGDDAPEFMWPLKKLATNEDCVNAYMRLVVSTPGKVDEIRQHLRGRNVACWCRLDQKCHGDTLLLLSNR